MEDKKCEEKNCTSEKAETTAQPEATNPDELAAINARLTELEDVEKRLMRLQADFDNFRRRTQKEKDELMDYAAMTLISKVLPVMDNFERALATTETTSENQGVLQGVQMIHRQLNELLQKEGVKEIDAHGHPFDPNFHEAVMQGPADDVDDNTVSDVFQKGYLFKDKVIRPAMVKVAKK